MTRADAVPAQAIAQTANLGRRMLDNAGAAPATTDGSGEADDFAALVATLAKAEGQSESAKDGASSGNAPLALSRLSASSARTMGAMPPGIRFAYAMLESRIVEGPASGSVGQDIPETVAQPDGRLSDAELAVLAAHSGDGAGCDTSEPAMMALPGAGKHEVKRGPVMNNKAALTPPDLQVLAPVQGGLPEAPQTPALPADIETEPGNDAATVSQDEPADAATPSKLDVLQPMQPLLPPGQQSQPEPQAQSIPIDATASGLPKSGLERRAVPDLPKAAVAGGVAQDMATSGAPAMTAKDTPQSGPAQAAIEHILNSGAARPSAAQTVTPASQAVAIQRASNPDEPTEMDAWPTVDETEAGTKRSTSQPHEGISRERPLARPLSAAPISSLTGAALATALNAADRREDRPVGDAWAANNTTARETALVTNPSTDNGKAGANDAAIITAAKPVILRQETHFTPILQQAPAQQIGERITGELTGLTSAAPTQKATTDNSAVPVVRVLHIQLTPPELGPLTIRMTLRHEALDLQLETGRHETAKLIERDREAISHLLRSAGYMVDGLSVQVSATDKPGAPSLFTGTGTQQQSSGQALSGWQQPGERGSGQSWQDHSRGGGAFGGKGDENAEAGTPRAAGGALYL